MRIAICTDIYLPQLSGIADSLGILARELKMRGHSVRIYAPHLPGAIIDPEIMRLPSYQIPGAGGLSLVMPLGVVRDMKNFKPDVIHTNTYSTAGLFALYAAWRLRVPLVGTDHTFPADYLHYVKLNFRPFPYLIKKFAAWYYNHCGFVTAPSKSMLNELAAYGMHRSVRAISNHIPSDVFRPLPAKEELKKKYGVGPRAILIFGRIAREKNLDYAVAIYVEVARRTDAELVFIGGGPYRAAIEKQVREQKLDSCVRFLGTLRDEPLVEAINACEVFLITSTSETQSMTTLQAMACCLPVVAIAAGGLPEYVHDGENGFVVSSEQKDLFVEKIITLLNNTELAQRLGAAGRVSVAPFAPEHIAGQFEGIYRNVIRQSYGSETV
ncbi:MAG: glycosyltransferase [bacterium]|nr:glycosyltransferase [bacterium]MDZ4299364.1 glycosyltransferase [Candidatus Sungbacteria bacterium]